MDGYYITVKLLTMGIKVVDQRLFPVDWRPYTKFLEQSVYDYVS